jgi:hypothetical protein
MSKETRPSRTTLPANGALPSAIKLQKKSEEVVNARGVRAECDFRVRRDGRWCIFDGRVDSQSTKTELFGLVPEVDGALWIVDKLQTGRGRGGKRSK